MSISIDGSGSITGIDQGLSVSGVLTFDDVTNVDSIGVITARSGVHVTGGTVGIGTDNPSWGLDLQRNAITQARFIRNNAGDSYLRVNSHTGNIVGLQLGDNTDVDKQMIRADNTNNALIFNTANSEKLRIDSNNVNIGVNASSNPFTYLRFGASQYGAADIRPTDESSHKIGLAFYVDGTQDTTINPTEALRIQSDGKVGIGSDTPTRELDVAGSINIGKNVTTNTSVTKIFNPTHLTVNRGSTIRFGLEDGGFGGIEVENTTGSNGSFNSQNVHIMNHNGGVLGDIRSLTARFDGNIGINSTSPTEKLDVDGNIKLSGILQENIPADLWSPDSSFYCISDGGIKLGNITHQGSYRVHITSNGYRNPSNQWTSYAANNFTGAAAIGVDPQGVIIFGTESNKSNGSAANITERVRIDDDRMTFAQNRRLRFAPNSSWGAGLNVGGNGNSADATYGSMAVTNGNLHLDAREGTYGIYLNWYGGSNGTYFGNGNSQQRGRLDGSGNFSVSGSYPGSDLRLKENIETITGATDTIKALVGKTFTWKPEAGLDSYKRYGFIAQEVQQVVPDLVKAIGCHYFDADDNLIDNIDPTESDEDRESAGLTRSLTVNNEGVTPILVEAMKELIAKVETLETRISTLEGN
tara:strand:+ start:5462 stop:7381 length:1920 start_codon:yes stop_codon:yes gene_type:complete